MRNSSDISIEKLLSNLQGAESQITQQYGRSGQNTAYSATAYIYSGWRNGGQLSDEVQLEFVENGSTLKTRWLNDIIIDSPISFEQYAGTVAPASGFVSDLFYDERGSATLAVDQSGEITSKSSFEAFGLQNESGVTRVELGFVGRESDSELGLIYFRARHLDPRSGLFLQPDPVGFHAGDANLYRYAFSNPWTFFDPDGLTSSKGGGRGGNNGDWTINSEVRAQLRESAIEAVAEGVFAGALMINGQISAADAMLDWAGENRKKPGRRGSHSHHCWPRYLTLDGSGPQVRINERRHVFLHRAQRKYLRLFNLDWGPHKTGRAIRRDYDIEPIVMVLDMFYEDMRKVFKQDFRC